MDQTQQRVGTVVTVIGRNVLREAEHHLVLLVQPMTHLEAHLGIALVGVVDTLVIDAQLAAIGMDQAQGAIGGGGEVVGGEGLQAIQRILLEVGAEVVVVLAIELGFEVGLQHPVFADALGVVVDEGGAPAVGPRRDVGVLPMVFANGQGDQGQQAAVGARRRVIDEEQRAAHLWIAEAAFPGVLRRSGQARVDIGEGHDELRGAQSAAEVGEEHLAVGHGIDLQLGLAGAVGRAVEVAGTGGRQVQHAEAGAGGRAEEVAGVKVGGGGVQARQAAGERQGAEGGVGHGHCVSFWCCCGRMAGKARPSPARGRLSERVGSALWVSRAGRAADGRCGSYR